MPSSFPSLKLLEFSPKTSDIAVMSITKNLTNLTYLDIDGCSNLKFLPEEFLHKNKLLHILKIRSCPEFEGFLSKEDNKYKEVELDSSCHYSVLTTDEGLGALEELFIKECPKLHMIPDTLLSLKALSVNNSNNSLMGWLTSKLTTLTYLWIEDIPDLTSLPSALLKNNKLLKELSICKCPALQEFYANNGNNSLECLTQLVLRDCPSLKSMELQGLASLTFLEIGNCEGLHSLPEVLALLPHLERLRIRPLSEELDYFPFLESTTEHHHFLSLRKLEICGSPKLKSLPHQVQHLTKLKRLQIEEFEGLIDLPEWLGNLTSLEELMIRSCTNLLHLPSKEVMQQCLTLLEYVEIENCPLLVANFYEERGGAEWKKISHISTIKIDEDYVS